jgi:hypothetical protein
MLLMMNFYENTMISVPNSLNWHPAPSVGSLSSKKTVYFAFIWSLKLQQKYLFYCQGPTPGALQLLLKLCNLSTYQLRSFWIVHFWKTDFCLYSSLHNLKRGNTPNTSVCILYWYRNPQLKGLSSEMDPAKIRLI